VRPVRAQHDWSLCGIHGAVGMSQVGAYNPTVLHDVGETYATLYLHALPSEGLVKQHLRSSLRQDRQGPSGPDSGVVQRDCRDGSARPADMNAFDGRPFSDDGRCNPRRLQQIEGTGIDAESLGPRRRFCRSIDHPSGDAALMKKQRDGQAARTRTYDQGRRGDHGAALHT